MPPPRGNVLTGAELLPDVELLPEDELLLPDEELPLDELVKVLLGLPFELLVFVGL